MSALARLLAVLAWRREEAGPPPAPPPAHPAVLVHVIGYPPASRPAVAAGGVQASAGGAAPPRPPAPAQRPPADALGALAEALLSEAADPLTPRDRERLRGVHPHLVRVVERAARSERLMVIEGLRTRDRQAALVASGASRTMDSRHLTGHAVDLGPVPLDWNDTAAFHRMARVMGEAARIEGVPIVWGGSWRGFFDGPHFELSRDRYPA